MAASILAIEDVAVAAKLDQWRAAQSESVAEDPIDE
jgi:phosphoribosylcarboxyaminoimidazole (NCAIR) mutase